MENKLDLPQENPITMDTEPTTERAQTYHYPEIMDQVEQLETSMIAKMKDKIDQGTYDLIISDEGSGRIPTLIFREIYRSRNPDKKFETVFINGSGNGIQFDPGQVPKEKFLRKKDSQYAVLISEFMEKGLVIKHFAENARDAGIPHFDVGVLNAVAGEDRKGVYEADQRSGIDNFFYGVSYSLEDNNPEPIISRHDHKEEVESMSGIIRRSDRALKGYPHPIKSKTYDPEKVAEAREDIYVAASRILAKVWPEENVTNI